MNIKKILNDIKNAFIDIIIIWVYVLDLSLLIVMIDYFNKDIFLPDFVYCCGMFLCLHFYLPLEFICKFFIWISVV